MAMSDYKKNSVYCDFLPLRVQYICVRLLILKVVRNKFTRKTVTYWPANRTVDSINNCVYSEMHRLLIQHGHYFLHHIQRKSLSCDP